MIWRKQVIVKDGLRLNVGLPMNLVANDFEPAVPIAPTLGIEDILG
jgi:hypothetical protein